MKKNQRIDKNVFTISWKTILASAAASFFLAFSIYLLFLQPDHVISRVRLLMAGGLWLLLFGVFLTLLGFDLFKLGKLAARTILLAVFIGMGFSAVLFWSGFGLESMPYNLLLLPRHLVEIQPVCQAGSGQTMELKYFIDGLDVVSFNAFETVGKWERTQDSLLTHDCGQARLTYHGWLAGKPSLAFRTRPDGASVDINWDGAHVTQALSSPGVDQVIVTRELGMDAANKTSSLLVFLFSLTVLLFPLTSQFAREITHPGDSHFLRDWFEETAANLRPLILFLLIASLIASAGLIISPWLEMDHTPVSPADPAVKTKPNIIVIIADSMTAEDMSLFGYPLPTTPNLEKETKDWTIFTNANTAATCTIGIFPALNSGRYPIFSYPFSQYGEKTSSSADWVNLMEMMTKAGYSTYWNNYYILPTIYHNAQGIDNFLFFPTNNFLFHTWFQTKVFRKSNFPHLPYSLQLAGPLFLQNSLFNDSPRVLGDMLVENQFKSPFLIYMHYRGSHFGSYYSGKYLGTFLPKSEGMTGYYDQNALLGPYPPDKQAQVDKLRMRYDEAILHEDDSLGSLIEKIKQAGLFDSSLILVLSDHGQVFNNGFVAHCTPLISYSETHIPLLVKFPNQQQGARNPALVSIIDITPTILDVANVHYEKTWFDGISLLSSQSQFDARSYLFIRNLNDQNDIKTPSYAVMNNRYKLTLRQDGYYLYDYLNDPNEKNNLFSSVSIDGAMLKSMQLALQDYVDKVD
jgi:arylsulfatase A-like enzyme